MKNEQTLVERVARKLCEANYEDPEMMVACGPPILTRYGHAAAANARPNWTHYIRMAGEAIEAVGE